MKIIIANSNVIHRKIEKLCEEQFNACIVHTEDELRTNLVGNIDFIFFLHWSIIIPAQVYNSYNCIVFHMTDLPYGRGGSPLQNLIVRGHIETKISALKVQEGLDKGDIYLKKELSLLGTAEEIFIRAGKIMFDMIKEIINNKITPAPQIGEPVFFKRRKPEDGNLYSCGTLEEIFRCIQMLDAEGYDPAFIETEGFRLEFTRASLKTDKILADVKIMMKK